MKTKAFDLIVCRIDVEETLGALQKRILERFPRIAAKNANGIMNCFMALADEDYSYVLIVTSWHRINAAHHMVGRLRMAGVPVHYVFVYALAPGDSSKRLQVFENDFAQGQEDAMLEKLGHLLAD